MANPFPKIQSTSCRGAAGTTGALLIVAPAEDSDVQPREFITLNVYVPVATSWIVTLAPVPSISTFPGDLVRVHVPAAGNPPTIMVPVLTSQPGWVIVPIEGAEGRSGALFRVAPAEEGEVHPADVTVKV